MLMCKFAWAGVGVTVAVGGGVCVVDGVAVGVLTGVPVGVAPNKLISAVAVLFPGTVSLVVVTLAVF